MAISSEDIAEVRARTDLVALIGEKAALKRQGRRWTGLCPFHQEKSPSFSVNAEEGFYYCFGCGASGDAITFIRETERLDFLDAVRLLAERAGVALHEDPAAAGQQQRTRALYDAVQAAVEFYHQRLLSAPDAGRARDYLRSRGYDGEVVRRFKLGWAPDAWDALAQHLKVAPKVLEDAGLGFTNRAGRAQDAFRARVTFPICDPSGRPIALGARILPPRPDDAAEPGRRPEPKYKNSTETAIYVKRRTLYALNWAKDDIIKQGEVIVCEGYTDVIGCFQAGLPRAVATCGTALAEEHFKLLTNFARRIIFAYDADQAGQSAITRVYEWEQAHAAEVLVAALPPGADPGQLALEDPEALRRAMHEARPLLEFRFERVFEGTDLSTPERRVRVADAALAVVAEHPSDLVRDQYAMAVADRCWLKPEQVRPRLETLVADPTARTALLNPEGTRARHGTATTTERAERPEQPRADPSARPGLEALRIAVHRPESVAHRLEPELFSDALQRRTFVALLEADQFADAVESADDDVAALLRRLVVEEPMLEVTDLGDPVDACVHQLLRVASRRCLDRLGAEARQHPEALGALTQETAQVRGWLAELDDPAAKVHGESQLLAWLLVRGAGD